MAARQDFQTKFPEITGDTSGKSGLLLKSVALAKPTVI